MERNFAAWLSTFKESIATYYYYVDFQKIYKNVEDIKVELNILNALIGSKNIESDFMKILQRYPETIKCIPILIAVRSQEIAIAEKTEVKHFNFDTPLSQDLSDISAFMRNFGLFDLLANHLISNLVDYVTGVETGLDSNGRKNRGGDLMETLVKSYIAQIPGVQYYEQMKKSEIKANWGIDLKVGTAARADKKFDFVVKTPSTIYAIEANFYTGSGSKLNETARSYKELALEAQSVDGYEFVWITDGIGWKTAAHNLQETFDVMTHIYNISEMESGVLGRIFL